MRVPASRRSQNQNTRSLPRAPKRKISNEPRRIPANVSVKETPVRTLVDAGNGGGDASAVSADSRKGNPVVDADVVIVGVGRDGQLGRLAPRRTASAKVKIEPTNR